MINNDEWRMKLDSETYNVMRERGGHLGHLFDDGPKGRALKNTKHKDTRYKHYSSFNTKV